MSVMLFKNFNMHENLVVYIFNLNISIYSNKLFKFQQYILVTKNDYTVTTVRNIFEFTHNYHMSIQSVVYKLQLLFSRKLLIKIVFIN